MHARPKLTRIESTALACLALGAGLLITSCGERSVDVAATTRSGALTADGAAGPGDLDVLFMIDNSSSMTEKQQKLYDQLPQFVTALEDLPTGLPNIHIAVVSSDMGAPGDATSSIGCTSVGDNGQFQSMPRGTCTVSPLATGTSTTGDASAPATGANYLSNVGGVVNYTGNLSEALQCIAFLGDNGCGFEHQLASVARALGADGAPAPASNAGFLRPNAKLAIILLSDEDDCSAPPDTLLYSLNVGGSNQQNIDNALGPVANYRCNAFGHLCVNPAASTSCLIEPPDQVPPEVQSSASGALNLWECESADGSGLLTALSSFVQGIRSLKADPDHQIVVGAIVAPATPYTVSWVPEQGGQNTQPGELWPQVEHSCGPVGGDDVNPQATQNPTDGSFGDPAVRITQFVKAFGNNGIVGSVCDASYSSTVAAIANQIGRQLSGTLPATGVGGGLGTSALPVCGNGLNTGPDSGVVTGAGGSGSVGCGAGGVPGGTGGSPIGTGLHGGGCQVGASRPGVWALVGLGVLLALARRRRAAVR